MVSAWFDPRLTVFVIWGIFVILFICIPSKRFFQSLCVFMGCSCCAYEEEIAPSNNETGMSYEILSNARKQEMDSLRASHITYRLHPFSLTLQKKHMLRRSSDSESPTDNFLPQDRKLDDVKSCTCSEDIEAGLKRGIDPPEQDGEGEHAEGYREVENDEGEGVQYTHVSIPKPGHNFDCIDVFNSPTTFPEDEKKPKEENKRTKLRIFGCKEKEEAKDSTKEEPNSTKELDEKGKRRSCTIFCAICLAEYEMGERITWSSNPDCTHAFHEDCVAQWLVSLGRTKSNRQRFGEDLTEAQLLNYELECPCCRQEFISRGQAGLPDVCGEESV
mmetsp:Transcript_17452/g.36573  ORF Transcript_17452/g.36573 Transcript_17452/m.36573 type:complete len:331 (+) Transcript_17452:274-1266(+)